PGADPGRAGAVRGVEEPGCRSCEARNRFHATAWWSVVHKWLNIFCPNTGQIVELSPDAAGVVACLYAAQGVANDTPNDADSYFYYRLRDYATWHMEAQGIEMAIE
ncbi:MAG: antirestriction protein, partial [Desulfatitalea sp.]|nr:antirestriction protein [Desulfatitalea sp.]